MSTFELLFFFSSPQLSNRRFRSAAMLSVFAISAVVHEYALTMCFGFFYPVMFCTFAVIGGKAHHAHSIAWQEKNLCNNNKLFPLLARVGFYTPCVFLSVVFNFAINDKRKSHVWNIIMWTCLMLGQGVHVCLYCQEWYAQIHCPRTGVGSPSQLHLHHMQ